MDFMPGGLHRACKVASLCHILGSKIMKLLRSWFLIGALTGLMLATSIPAKSMPGQPPAKISPPEVIFQVTATRDTVNRGDTLDFVCSVANHSQILLEKLEIMPLPQRPEINLSMPAWQSVPAFGSETNQATGKVTDNADFGMHHLVFVLKYTWKGDSATYTSTQAATVNGPVKFRLALSGTLTSWLASVRLPACAIFPVTIAGSLVPSSIPLLARPLLSSTVVPETLAESRVQ